MLLTSCVFSVPTGSAAKTSAPTQSQSTPSQAPPSTSGQPSTSQPPSTAPPSSGASASPSPQATSGTGGLYGAFGTKTEACLAVSATLLSVSILPLAGAFGGKPEDVAKAQEELATLRDKVPDELKPHFAKLEAFTKEAGTDFSKYGTGEYEALIKPIQDWMDKNCS